MNFVVKILAQNAANNRLFSTSYYLQTINYKTPTNRTKKFSPTSIPVTKANAHLEINLTDQLGKELGRFSMRQAQDMADRTQLKLVIIDDATSPPKFQLMTGQELFKLQMSLKETERAEKQQNLNQRVLKEKEVDLNLGISDHDFETKLKMIANFYEKGHPIKIKVASKINNSQMKNISKLQDEFVKKLEKAITYAKVKTQKVAEQSISLYIESKNEKSK